MHTIEKIVKKGKYLYAVVSGHPQATKRNYVLHHRVVMENFLGRYLETDEVVHHKDENTHNNKIENLEVLSKSDHSKLHAKIGRTMIACVCKNCGIKFKKEIRFRNPKNKNTFCSRRCNGKFNGYKRKY